MISDNTAPDANGRDGVDLTTCDREPIHQLGKVQSYGALIAISSDWTVRYVSKNIAQILSSDFDGLAGHSLTDVLSQNIVHRIAQSLQFLVSGHVDLVDRVFGVELLDNDTLFDLAFHRSGGLYVIEIELSDKNAPGYLSSIRPMIDELSGVEHISDICKIAAQQVAGLSNFDRVMVYEFDADGSGHVVAETKKDELPSFLGLRYPASDIPKQARALYKRSLLRIIADVSSDNIEIEADAEFAGLPLDLSLSTTRAVSPIHLEYLRNMNVSASLSISIIVNGELWGLFACHHDSPKILSYELRTALELYTQLISFLFAQKQMEQQRVVDEKARILHDRLLVRCASDHSLASNFNVISEAIAPVIPFDGMVGWIDGKFQSRGDTPTEEEFLPLVKFLKDRADTQIFATDALATQYEGASSFLDRAAGLLALPMSRSGSDFVVLFRREAARSVNWAGDPAKLAIQNTEGVRLSPRKSFESWKETVRGKSEIWSKQQIQIAQSLKNTLLEVVLYIADRADAERARVQSQQEILIAELNHRVRNSLHLVKSLIAQSTDGTKDVASFTAVLDGRIHALARAHDQITRENWTPASLRTLIETEALAYFGNRADRLMIKGDDVLLKPNAFTNVALVMHELMTNSAKYGALCDSNGSILVELSLLENGDIRLKWTERGGPAIEKQPQRSGFGTTIIENSIPHELGGTALLNYRTTGLVAEFTIPAIHFIALAVSKHVTTEIMSEPQSKAEQPDSLSGGVLILEDNMLIALEIEKMAKNIGAKKVYVAANNQSALEIIDRHPITFALLDVNLGHETSEPVATVLTQKGVRFLFASGYGSASTILDTFPAIAIVQKPFSQETLQKIIAAEPK